MRTMATARCCPADCALRSDWEDELRAEKEMLERGFCNRTARLPATARPPAPAQYHPDASVRDHCVCEFFYVFEEPRNLISYNLKKLKDGGLIESYYRSNHRIYKLTPAAEPNLRRILGSAVR